MPYKDPEKQRAYLRTYYQENMQARKATAQTSRVAAKKRNREFVNALKSSTPCADCGKTYPPYVMQFDHMRNKTFAVAELVNRAVSLKTLKAEIAKCELVCANCHAIRTYERAH
jgi:hypothetical protein